MDEALLLLLMMDIEPSGEGLEMLDGLEMTDVLEMTE